jgi:hypothetical protein
LEDISTSIRHFQASKYLSKRFDLNWTYLLTQKGSYSNMAIIQLHHSLPVQHKLKLNRQHLGGYEYILYLRVCLCNIHCVRILAAKILLLFFAHDAAAIAIFGSCFQAQKRIKIAQQPLHGLT